MLPVLLLLLFGVIEFGRFILAYQSLNDAVREGARYGIVHGANSDCPSGPMPGAGTSLSACADPSGSAVQDKVIAYGFTLKLAGATGAVVPTSPPTPAACPTPGPNQVAVCWPDLDNARGHDVQVVANATFSTIIPLPLPQIGMTARSTLVINH